MAETAPASRSAKVNLGSVEKVPKGQGFCFIVSGEEIAVFRQRDGSLFAVQNRCPHRQGPLSEGVMGAGKVICPLHSHKFDLCTGEGPQPDERVKTYAVSEEKGQILLAVEERPSAAPKVTVP
jgi:nitrite reductase (NADH) small subunit